MYKETLEQLQKVKVKLPEYNENSELLVIPRTLHKVEILQINHIYLIEVAEYITNPPSNFTLSDNWNKGIVPKCKCMKIEVCNIQGKMIQVNAFGYDYINQCDLPYTYMGLWLPIKSITILETY